MTFAPGRPNPLAGLLLGLMGVAALTLTFTRLLPVNPSTAGFLYLLVVLAVASQGSFPSAAAVSLAAMLCFNYFHLPPVGRFTVADPENWIALFTFLMTALVASHLSGRARQQAEEVRARHLETEQLYALSRAILLTDASQPIGTQAAHRIAQIFDSPLVLILDAKTNHLYHGGPEEGENLEARLLDVVRVGNRQRDASRDIDFWPIALGGSPIGALAAKGVPLSDGAIQSLLNLVAIALERVRILESANRAEIARLNEQFKSTLLDAIAHEFKTPLTSIKAAVSGFRALPAPLPPDQIELTSIIEEEADRLSLLVTEAVQMARIDAGKITPQRLFTDPATLLQSARDSFHGRGADQIEMPAPAAEPWPPVLVDAALITLALRQVFDNALKYAAPGSRVYCFLDADDSLVRVRIANRGTGIPDGERDRIFDKFYRGPAAREGVPGTGLGLHIAREIARGNGGDLYAEPAAEGVVFCFVLPRTEEAKP